MPIASAGALPAEVAETNDLAATYDGLVGMARVALIRRANVE